MPEPVWWRSALLRNLVSCENRPKMADDRRFLLGLSNNPGCLLDGQGLGITRHDVQNKKTLSRAQDANKSSLNHPIKSLKVAQRYEKIQYTTSLQINGSHLLSRPSQPLETVLRWPRSPASNSSSFGVIGERHPQETWPTVVRPALFRFRREAAAVLPALPNNLLHHPSTNKTHIERLVSGRGVSEV